MNCQGAVLIVSYNIYSVKHVNCKGAILLLDKLWIIDYNITMAETNWAKAQKEVARWGLGRSDSSAMRIRNRGGYYIPASNQ